MKRAFDILVSAFSILALFPLGLLIAIAVKLSDGGPVLYRQSRVGQFGRPFGILKFRTMVVGAERMGPSVTQGRDPRITAVGRLLRKTKLDELPQLWNVLKGEMSFVGPRPEVPRYVDTYTPEQRQVLLLKPGITDLASLLFRDEETLLRGVPDVEDFYVRYCMPKKIALNLEHAARCSLLKDAWIMLRTVLSLGSGLNTKSTDRRCSQGYAVVADSENSVRVARDVLKSPDIHMPLVAVFSDDPHTWGRKWDGLRVAGMPECLLSADWRERVKRVVIVLPHKQRNRAQEIKSALKDLTVTICTENNSGVETLPGLAAAGS